jgi:hydrogenase/urease accessory protein HupE
MKRLLRTLGNTLLLLLMCTLAQAHESLPASLLLQESRALHFDVTWRIPQTQGVALDIRPMLPDDCVRLDAPRESTSAGARRWQWTVQCTQGLRTDARIGFDGLPLTMVDVLVRVNYHNGDSESRVARPRTPTVVLGESAPQPPAASAYLGLGVEHILGGIDHLLFVLCLILLAPSLGSLLQTVTAFTVAHSLTLALSALGWVHVSGPPVEATIALSILFLARELVRRDAGSALVAQRPWTVAFVFGLLHGFGFAGALSEIGLPPSDIPASLLLFNVGVELGQLIFVACVYPLVVWVRRAARGWSARVAPLPIYAVGAVAAFWWLQRMGSVLQPLIRPGLLV